MSSDLRQACFELARITKWDLKPVDTAAIQVLSDRFYQIAKDQENADLDIDLALITRAVRYLANVHAIPPMDENTSWFYDMLRVVLEIARPNTGVNDENKQFLKDMLYGIADS